MHEIETTDKSADVGYYLDHIAKYESEFKPWQQRAGKILQRYRDDNRNSQDSGARFNILWSMVQTLKSATFARMPKPDVSRKFADNDPVGRVASLILERALDYELNTYSDFHDTLTSCILDRFLPGRGVAWTRYEPHIRAVQSEPDDGYQVTEDTDEAPEQEEQLEYECAPTDYVHWRDFGHEVARSWDEISIIWRKVYMTKSMLKQRFGEEALSIPLDAAPEQQDEDKKKFGKRALVYEIWDKNTGKALWLSKTLGRMLDEKEDPLGLQDFFPCPKPIYATITNDSLVPVPDYALYQDQALTLDLLCSRIEELTKALAIRGVYDASISDLSRLFSEGSNNTLIPVNNVAALSEKGGLRGVIDLVDIQPIAQALINSYQAFEQVKNQIYDITGISDIIRGQSAASETATAQQIKGQYASLRLKAYQDQVSRFAATLIQHKAQVICSHFDDDTILKISAAEQLAPDDQQLIPQALQLLRSGPMRSFRIEVTSDSMIIMDETQEKQDRVEFLTAVGGFLEKAVQASAAAPQVVPLVLDLLKFGVQGFKAGRTIEGRIDNAIDQFKQEQQQRAAQPPQPSTDQLQIQAEQQKFQMEQQMETQRHQMEMQQMGQLEQMRQQLDAQTEERRAEREMFIKQQDLMFQKWAKMLEAQTKIQVAEVSANATLSHQQDIAATQGVMP